MLDSIMSDTRADDMPVTNRPGQTNNSRKAKTGAGTGSARIDRHVPSFAWPAR
jgi:hypothetical protein